MTSEEFLEDSLKAILSIGVTTGIFPKNIKLVKKDNMKEINLKSVEDILDYSCSKKNIT